MKNVKAKKWKCGAQFKKFPSPITRRMTMKNLGKKSYKIQNCQRIQERLAAPTLIAQKLDQNLSLKIILNNSIIKKVS